MCNDLDAPTELPDPRGGRDAVAGLTRRRLLGSGGLLAASALLPGGAQLLFAGKAYAGSTPDGGLVVPMAMHVHGSFSEGAAGVSASWQTQLTEAEQAGVRVLWPTDHDWRMSAFQAPGTFHTAALDERVVNRNYHWLPDTDGALSSSTATAVSSPASPADSAAQKGSLHLAATSSGASPASIRLYLDAKASNHPHRTNVTGQQIRLQVLPDAVGPDAWGELLLMLSHHPATGGRPGGSYQLSYRFGTGTAAPHTESLLAVIPVPVTTGSWNEVTLDLAADVARAWPDLVAHDNALTDLWLGATSRQQQAASVHFAYIRFTHDADGDRPLDVQAQIFDDYSKGFPTVDVRHGLEVSLSSAHINWFGGAQHLIDYHAPEPTQARRSTATYIPFATSRIHRLGGLASLNHPFGSQNEKAPQAKQDAHRQALARELIPVRAYDADILEVGYRVRGGATLATHLGLWDALSRAGVWVTGNGVNDSHGGKQNDWSKLTNRFITSALAASTGEADLLTALAGGRAYVHEIGGFHGLLDIRVGKAAMGSVSVRPGVAARQLVISATDLPSGSQLRVVQGTVDYGSQVDSGAQVVATVPARSLATGTATVQIDTSTSSFVRVELWTSAAREVAFTNPIWLLQEMPPVTPPPPRRAADTVFTG